jgi:alginate biosynthesis protein Alg44
MNDLATKNLVHESEVQRQYPRVKLTGYISIKVGEAFKNYELMNLSSGGIGFKVTGSELESGEYYSARLVTAFAGVEYRIQTPLVIIYSDQKEESAGAMFDELGQRERSAIQLIVNSYISGELLEPEDMMNGSKRDNYVQPRKTKKVDDPGTLGFKAVFGTAIYSIIGLFAFFLVVYQVYDNYMVDRSTTASLSVTTIDVTMPRDAVFTNLIPEGATDDSKRVIKGQPLASYTVSALSFIDEKALSDPEVISSLETLSSQDFTGTLFSPCDCLIKEVNAIEGALVNRGKPLFTLVPENQTVGVLAKFRFQDSAYLEAGKPVELEVVGEDKTVPGTIIEFKMAQAVLDAEGTRGVDVWIQPSGPLPVEWVSRPVQVKVSRLDSALMSWM